MPSAKEKVMDIIQLLPEDSSYDDILVRLAAARKVRRGFIESGSNRRGDAYRPRQPIRLWT